MALLTRSPFILMVLSTMMLGLTSQPLYAIVDAEVTYGSRTSVVTYDTASATGKTKSFSGPEYTGSVMFDPIPVVPISFGLTAQSYSFDRSAVDKEIIQEVFPEISPTGKNEVTGVSYGPSLKVWAPTPYVQPYLKLSYLMGEEKSKFNTSFSVNDSDATLSGTSKEQHTATEIQLGLSTKQFKFLRLSLELALHSGKNRTKSYSGETVTTTGGETTTESMSTDDLTDEDKKSRNAGAYALRFGLAFSL